MTSAVGGGGLLRSLPFRFLSEAAIVMDKHDAYLPGPRLYDVPLATGYYKKEKKTL